MVLWGERENYSRGKKNLTKRKVVLTDFCKKKKKKNIHEGEGGEKFRDRQAGWGPPATGQ